MSEPRYLVYTKPLCPFCVKAKQLLEIKGIPFKSISLDDDEARLKFLEGLRGWRTFPVIFALSDQGVPSRFIGGFDQLSKELSVTPS